LSLPATGPWELPVEGWKVLTVIFAFQIDIIAYGYAGSTCTIRLAGAFELSESGGRTHELDAARQSWEELAPVLSLRHDALSSVMATDNAQLLVSFGSGRKLGATADDTPYEHWEVTAPGGRLIALPGRARPGVAVFSDP
jgi:Family of unknown function (DUF6188)